MQPEVIARVFGVLYGRQTVWQCSLRPARNPKFQHFPSLSTRYFVVESMLDFLVQCLSAHVRKIFRTWYIEQFKRLFLKVLSSEVIMNVNVFKSLSFGLCARSMLPVLSQRKASCIGSLKSFAACFSQMSWRAVSDIAIYSASVVLIATDFCFEGFHNIAESPHLNR